MFGDKFIIPNPCKKLESNIGPIIEYPGIDKSFILKVWQVSDLESCNKTIIAFKVEINLTNFGETTPIFFDE